MKNTLTIICLFLTTWVQLSAQNSEQRFVTYFVGIGTFVPATSMAKGVANQLPDLVENAYSAYAQGGINFNIHPRIELQVGLNLTWVGYEIDYSNAQWITPDGGNPGNDGSIPKGVQNFSDWNMGFLVQGNYKAFTTKYFNNYTGLGLQNFNLNSFTKMEYFISNQMRFSLRNKHTLAWSITGGLMVNSLYDTRAVIVKTGFVYGF